MKRTFTIATGQLDSQGDIINIDGVIMTDKINLTENFDKAKVIGEAELKREDGVLKAIAEIPDRLLDAYPAIGFKLIKSRMEGDAHIIDELELHQVGICKNQNVDESIKSIREQTAS